MKPNDLTVATEMAEQECIEQSDFAVGDWVYIPEECEDNTSLVDDLWCVVYKGINYYRLHSIHNHIRRIHVDNAHIMQRVNNAKELFDKAVKETQQAINNKIKELQKLIEGAGVKRLTATTHVESSLPVIHSTNTDNSLKALERVQNHDIKEIQKEIKDLGRKMECYCKAPEIECRHALIEIDNIKQDVANYVRTVRIYAGTDEEIAMIKDGIPADANEIIHVFRSRLYMDEECVTGYRAGGISIESVEQFDKWITEESNLKRILPYQRSIVAFRVRHKQRQYNDNDLFEYFVRLRLFDLDKTTFLYIRDGQRVYRLLSDLDFGETLFPDGNDGMFGGKLWTNDGFGSIELYTEAEKRELIGRDKRSRYRREFRPLDWTNVYLEDGLRLLQSRATDFNLFALLLQGIIDRRIFENMPRVVLWKPSDFKQWIKLIDDYGRLLADGNEPDFEAYRAKLNRSITATSVLTGQHDYWMRREAQKENNRQERDYRCKHPIRYYRYKPYGNPGPPDPAIPFKITKRGAQFKWTRQRRGWPYEQDVECHITVPLKELLNIDAYKQGDYLQFYHDPRTRRNYMQWAYLMLAAEEYVNGNKGIFDDSE